MTPTTREGWRWLVRRILLRDASICHHCKEPGSDQVEYIVPLDEGGDDHPSNLAAVHQLCALT